MRSRGFFIEALCPKFLPYSMRKRGFLIKPWLVRLYLSLPIKPMAGQMLIVGKKLEEKS
jgi:hypothetical protein